MKSEKFDAIGPSFSPHGKVVGSFFIKDVSCFKSSLKCCRSLEDVASAMIRQMHVVCRKGAGGRGQDVGKKMMQRKIKGNASGQPRNQ